MAKVLNEHKATPFVIADFETGGRDPKKNPITEIGLLALKGDTLEEIGRYNALIKPYDPKLEYTEEAANITGLTEKKLEKEGKLLSVVQEEVIKFLQDANVHNSKTQHKPVLIAHNASFELAYFQHFFEYNGKSKELPKLMQGMEDYYDNYVLSYVDTIHIAKFIWGGNIKMKSFNLEAVCDRATIALPDGHRAMNDVIPTTELIRQVIKMLRTFESGGGSIDAEGQLSFRDNFKFQY